MEERGFGAGGGGVDTTDRCFNEPYRKYMLEFENHCSKELHECSLVGRLK